MDDFAPFFLTLCVGFCLGVFTHAVMSHRDKPATSTKSSPRWRMRSKVRVVAIGMPPSDYISLDGDKFAPGVLEDAVQRWNETPPDKRTHISVENQSPYFTSREDFEAWMAKNGTVSGLPSRKIADSIGYSMAEFIRKNKDGGV